MKNFLRSISQKIVKNNTVWNILKKIFSPVEYLMIQRRVIERDIDARKLIETYTPFFSDHKVKNGPFSGMIYPEFRSVGSALFPKLLGSYEKEIHPFIYDLQKKNYAEIIDVGCAEGYYAIGLSLLFKEAEVYAFDTDSEAKILCRKMADLNGVQNKIHVGNFFSSNDLANFSFTGKGLIICDCEGYELELFNSDSIKNLKNCDLIIELHDFKNPTITPTILNLFSATHDKKMVNSLDDQTKVEKYNFPELKKFNYHQKFELLRETRPQQMSWVYFTPKQEI